MTVGSAGREGLHLLDQVMFSAEGDQLTRAARSEVGGIGSFGSQDNPRSLAELL